MRKLTVWIITGLSAVLAAIVVWLYLIVRGEPLKPETPPLLIGAHATGGSSNGWCPPDDEDFPGSQPETGSPEIERRLAKGFPPGSSEAALVQYLHGQGFKRMAPCANDPSIRRANFFQHSGGGLFGPYPAFAVVGWKVDADGRVVWTRAEISFTGL